MEAVDFVVKKSREYTVAYYVAHGIYLYSKIFLIFAAVFLCACNLDGCRGMLRIYYRWNQD